MIHDPTAKSPSDGSSTNIPGVFHKSEKLLLAILESATQAIISIDRGGRIVLANRRAVEMFGYSGGELQGARVELLLGELPSSIEGTARIRRHGSIVWEKRFLTGEDNMSHHVRNLEYHHFKYPMFRRPGDVHIHFFGTATLSFTDGVRTQDGDVFEIDEKGALDLPAKHVHPTIGPCAINAYQAEPTPASAPITPASAQGIFERE
jgi:PAS domain-containing protein